MGLVALPLNLYHIRPLHLSLGSRPGCTPRRCTASAHSSDGSDWETKYCKQHPDDKECTPWCLEHPKKDLCSDNLSKYCKSSEHYKSKECKKFLKKVCPAKHSKHLKDACKYIQGDGPPHNNCIVGSENGGSGGQSGGMLGATRSTDAPYAGPSKDEIADAFNSFQDSGSS